MSGKKLIIALCILLALSSLVAACSAPSGREPLVSPTVNNTDLANTHETLMAQLTVLPPTLTPLPVENTPAPVVDSPTSSVAQPTDVQPTDTVAAPLPPKPSVTQAVAVLPPTLTPLPTATNTPLVTDTPVPSPTRAASPTATYPSGDVRSGLAAPQWTDTFDGSQTWYIFEDDVIRFSDKDGKLNMMAKDANYKVGWALVPYMASEAYYVEMVGKFGACGALDRYGLMISPSSEAVAGYLFDISCDGKYSFWLWDGDEYTSLISWTASDKIAKGDGGVNRVGLQVDGKRMSLYVNGSLLQSVENDRMKKKYFGVFIGAITTDKFIVEVDEMSYWEIR